MVRYSITILYEVQRWIEDRKIGVVKEKFLEERITVDYSYNEIDDSKFYNNK